MHRYSGKRSNYFYYPVKVKVKFTLEQAVQAQVGSRGIIPYLGPTWGWVVIATLRSCNPRGKICGVHCTYCTGGWVGHKVGLRKYVIDKM
jgi:hypothetical protein